MSKALCAVEIFPELSAAPMVWSRLPKVLLELLDEELLLAVLVAVLPVEELDCELSRVVREL